MEEYKANPTKTRRPSLTDHTDPYYFIKYPHNLTPIAAYKMRPPKQELVSNEKNLDGRLIFYRWNNLTKFEIEQIKRFKEYLLKKKDFVIPDDFDERDVLKFIQANHWH